MGKFVDQNRKAVISVFSIFTMVVVLLMGSTNIYGRISDVLAKIEKAEVELNLLENKVEILSNAQASSVSDLANKAITVLPANNPVLQVVLNMSRIKNDISQFVITSLEVQKVNKSANTAGYNSTILVLEGTGTIDGFDNFVQKIATLSPITNIKSIDVRRTYGSQILNVEIELISFWSPLPSQLSNINQSISGLTSTEEQILGFVSQFSSPVYTGDNVDTDFAVRENPFVSVGAGQ